MRLQRSDGASGYHYLAEEVIASLLVQESSLCHFDRAIASGQAEPEKDESYSMVSWADKHKGRLFSLAASVFSVFRSPPSLN